MPHPAQPSAGTPSTGYSIAITPYTLPDQVLSVINYPVDGARQSYTLPDQVLDVLSRRGNCNKCYPSTGYSICYYTLPGQVLDVIPPSTGYSKCYTLPRQVLHVPRRRGNYNKCYTLPNQVLVPRRRGTAYAITK